MDQLSSEVEREAPFAGDYHAERDALQKKLAQLQFAQIVHKKRAIVVFEGWEGAGKLAALRRVTARWDPCHFRTWCVRQDEFRETGQHWLTPYWVRLPEAGDSALYFRSWYNGIIRARALGEMKDKRFLRALDEINEFEAQQRDYGTLLVKLFFEVSPEVQDRRLRERAMSPWAPLINRDPVVEVRHPEYAEALHQLRQNSDTRWSPWRIIDGNEDAQAAIAALSAVADAWAETMPAEPPRAVRSSGHAA